MSDLPKGWCVIKLERIARWGSGGTPSRGIISNYQGNIPWAKTGELGKKLLKDTEEKISPEALKNSSAKIFPKGSVAIAMYGATIGKVSIFNIDSATNQACGVGHPDKNLTSSIFLYYLLLNEKEAFIAKGKGGAQPNISQSIIKEHYVPLPPLPEQIRIAQKLDEILGKVDAIKARVDAVPAILKRFRQSVLAAAVSGKLTEGWREELIVDWQKTSLGKHCEYVSSGSRGWAKFYSDSGAIFVRAQNINTDVLVLDDVAYVSLPESTEGKRTKISEGDILITITGANVTKTAYVKNALPEAYVNQHVALARLHNPNEAQFVHLWLIAPNAGRKQLEDAAYGGGKPGLNLQNIKDVEILLPPIEEQKEIVRRVEELFAWADRVETKVKAAQERIDQLTQSVLAKAFRGELVPQDPNDEPAEKLLERIQAQRAAEVPKKKSPRKKAAPKRKKKEKESVPVNTPKKQAKLIQPPVQTEFQLD